MLKWLLALPFAAFILFNAYVYGNIITYRAVAPHQSAFMSMRMSEFRDAGKAVALDYRWVPYHAVSTNLKKSADCLGRRQIRRTRRLRLERHSKRHQAQ
jgi:monofunctional biosynthetic peptidoglycan transglycosylase